MDNLSYFNPVALDTSSSFTATAAATLPLTSTKPSLNTSRWQQDGNIVGPVIATLVGIELVLSLPSNLFILIYSLLNYRQSLNKSSTIFLFNLSLSNLLMTVFYMLFYIISSGAEEWIFGSTDFVRNILCQLHGFTFVFTNSISLHTLAVISFDRFLSIVKHHLHGRFLTRRTALWIVVILWVSNVYLLYTACKNSSRCVYLGICCIYHILFVSSQADQIIMNPLNEFCCCVSEFLIKGWWKQFFLVRIISFHVYGILSMNRGKKKSKETTVVSYMVRIFTLCSISLASC